MDKLHKNQRCRVDFHFDTTALFCLKTGSLMAFLVKKTCFFNTMYTIVRYMESYTGKTSKTPEFH